MITDECDSGASDETPAVFERGDIGAEMIDKEVHVHPKVEPLQVHELTESKREPKSRGQQPVACIQYRETTAATAVVVGGAQRQGPK